MNYDIPYMGADDEHLELLREHNARMSELQTIKSLQNKVLESDIPEQIREIEIANIRYWLTYGDTYER